MAIELADITLEQIRSFVKTGNPRSAPKEVVDYLDAMDMVRGMYRKVLDFGTENSIIKHLTKVNGLSYYQAKKLYDNTLEYFYCSRVISKQAWRNIYAEKLDDQITFAQAMQKDTKDAKAVADIVKIAMSARELDKEDVPELPAALFDKPYKLYTMDAKFLGMEQINRNKLAQIIDDLEDVTEQNKIKLKQDAAIIDITFLQDEQEDDDKAR